MRKLIGKFCMLMVMAMFLAFGLPTVLTADAQIARKEAGLQSHPVEASTQIYKGALTCLNAAGYLVAGADTAGHKFAGISYEKVLGTSQGTLFCRVHTEGVFKLPATSITQAMVGRKMYITNDGCMDDSSTNLICCGTLVEYISATEGWVDIGQRVASESLRSITLNGIAYATITLAMAAAAADDIIFLGPGTYSEDITWSSANNVTLQAKYPGTVVIESVTAFAVSVNPASSTGTWTFTIRDMTVSHKDGTVGILVNNTTVGKRINIMLDNVDIEAETSTDASIDVNRGGTSAHAIRLYATGHGNTIEGLVDYITESTDDRVRFWGYRLIGGLTVTGAIVMEVTLVCCGVKTSGFSVDGANVWNKIACYEETDANPNVHTATVDAVEQ